MEKKENILAIIGGSGISDAPTFKDATWESIDTGIEGLLDHGVVEYQQGDQVVFIPRHGRDHKTSPSKVNYKANIMAASLLGAKAIVATSAVGCLNKWNLGQLVIASDYIDLTGRDDNFFGDGFIVHASSKPSMSGELRRLITPIGKEYFNGVNGGVYCCIPGDRFGTRAEGRYRREMGANVVGMSICPEAALAQQAGIHYAAACFVVDMDDDANHEGGTLEVMRDLSRPEVVPAYMTRICEEVIANKKSLGTLDALEGNIIDRGGPSKNVPASIRALADRLRATYLHNT